MDAATGYLRGAFYWYRGEMTELGMLPRYEDTFTEAINDSGQVVGKCDREYPLPDTTFV